MSGFSIFKLTNKAKTKYVAGHTVFRNIKHEDVYTEYLMTSKGHLIDMENPEELENFINENGENI